jgi:hypothetical protein
MLNVILMGLEDSGIGGAAGRFVGVEIGSCKEGFM